MKINSYNSLKFYMIYRIENLKRFYAKENFQFIPLGNICYNFQNNTK